MLAQSIIFHSQLKLLSFTIIFSVGLPHTTPVSIPSIGSSEHKLKPYKLFSYKTLLPITLLTVLPNHLLQKKSRPSVSIVMAGEDESKWRASSNIGLLYCGISATTIDRLPLFLDTHRIITQTSFTKTGSQIF